MCHCSITTSIIDDKLVRKSNSYIKGSTLDCTDTFQPPLLFIALLVDLFLWIQPALREIQHHFLCCSIPFSFGFVNDRPDPFSFPKPKNRGPPCKNSNILTEKTSSTEKSHCTVSGIMSYCGKYLTRNVSHRSTSAFDDCLDHHIVVLKMYKRAQWWESFAFRSKWSIPLKHIFFQNRKFQNRSDFGTFLTMWKQCTKSPRAFGSWWQVQKTSVTDSHESRKETTSMRKPGSKDLTLTLWTCETAVSFLYIQLIGTKNPENAHQFHPISTWLSQNPETIPICNFTWQSCQQSQILWLVRNQTTEHLVCRCAPNKHFKVFWEQLLDFLLFLIELMITEAKCGVETWNNTFFANSQCRSMHFLACPATSQDHAVIFPFLGNLWFEHFCCRRWD